MTASSLVIPHILAVLLLFGFPLWDLWESSQLRKEPHEQIRIVSYLRTIIVLWLVFFLIIVSTPLKQMLRAPEVHGPLFPMLGREAILAFTFIVIVSMLLPVLFAVFNRALRRRLLSNLDKLNYLLPRNPIETILFGALALSAGICEELIYRGFLLRYLTEQPWGLAFEWSLFCSALIFGLAHAGQGMSGMVATAVIGLFLGWLYFTSGSLLPPMVIHSLIDLRILGFAILRTLSAR